ncbi:MAG: hypothetical protein GY928_06005, partial [Colwellia sp.]|nr:hypothetical protein [Colwellia sp.]
MALPKTISGAAEAEWGDVVNENVKFLIIFRKKFLIIKTWELFSRKHQYNKDR